MPIKLVECDESPLCYGFRWSISDEEHLAELVARLMLGQYRHVQLVLSGGTVSFTPQITNRAIDGLIGKLKKPEEAALQYHRDGWVFQMISWVAAHIANPSAITAIPHSQEAQKGFDNLILELEGETKGGVVSVVICEDKATENCRDTVREQVWPEIEDFETGRRDNQLVGEVTAILERCRRIVDVDKCVTDIFWERIRHYRVSITTHRDDNIGRRRLFKGYDEKAPGEKVRRRAETLQIERMRDWMDAFCEKITDNLEKLRCTTRSLLVK